MLPGRNALPGLPNANIFLAILLILEKNIFTANVSTFTVDYR